MGPRLGGVMMGSVLALGCAGPAWAAITPTITEYSSGITVSSAPNGITTGPDGNLYFAEVNHAAIGIITPAGAVTEITVPTPSGGSAPRPQDLVGDAGAVWFTDPSNNAIWSIGTGTTHPTAEYTAGMPASARPRDITVGPDANLWFSESNANLIGELGPNDPTHTIHNYPSTPLADPAGLTTGPDQGLWFTERNGQKIARLDPSNPNAAPATYSQGLSANAYPRGITAGRDHNLWFTEEGQNTAQGGTAVGRITPSGAITEFPLPVSTSSPAHKRPAGIVAGPDGALWFVENNGGLNTGVSNNGSGAIGRITPDGTITEYNLIADTTRESGDIGSTGPLHLTEGPDGNIWFTEIVDARVGRITTPPVAVTGGASQLTYRSASIAGTVADHAQPTSYHVDYGKTSAYGSSTASRSSGSNTSPNFVSTQLTKLTPNTTYHHRLVATNSTGTAYGRDATFTTPRAKPLRFRLHISPKHALTQPFTFKLSGKLVLPKGLRASVCTGRLKIRVTHAGHKVTTRKVRLKHKCTFSVKLVLPSLHGSGTLRLIVSFPGNQQLSPRSKASKARFG